jgi:hypothetical protein
MPIMQPAIKPSAALVANMLMPPPAFIQAFCFAASAVTLNRIEENANVSLTEGSCKVADR